MIFLRQSTASQEVPLGRFVDSGDGDTEETGLTIANTDIKIWKHGATSLANKNSGGATHMANGEYYCVLDATDTDTVGSLKITIHVSGALYVQVFCHVLEEAVYDAFFAASAPGYVANAPVNVAQFGGVAATTSGGRPEVNASHWAGAATATNDVALATAPTNFASLAITAAGGVTLADGVTHGGSTADFEARDISVAGTTNFVGAFVADNAGNQIKGIDSFTTAGKAELQDEANDAIVANRLDELLAADSDIDGAAPPTVGSVFHELMSKTAGSFTFDQTTDSMEALRDRGDAAWITATGFSTLDGAGVRSAVGLAAANLDTQLGDIPTNSELTTALANLDAAVSTRATPAQVATELATYDGPTNAEMEARTLVAASYATAAALSTAQNDLTQIKADLPTRPTKNTALANFPFVMRLSSDHVTGATGKTVTATRSIDGAGHSACANAVTEVANGEYKIDLAASDMNGNTITLRFTAADCDDTFFTIVTQP